MRQRVLIMVAAALSLSACGNEISEERNSPDSNTVSDAEMPAGQALALDSTHPIRVIEKGLQWDHGTYADDGRIVPSTHKFDPRDTAHFITNITGWSARDGWVSFALSTKVIAPDGTVVRERGNGFKTVRRVSKGAAEHQAFHFALGDLDPTVPYYDIEFRFVDKMSGKSIEGIYRVYLDRAR